MGNAVSVTDTWFGRTYSRTQDYSCCWDEGKGIILGSVCIMISITRITVTNTSYPSDHWSLICNMENAGILNLITGFKNGIEFTIIGIAWHSFVF